MTRLIEVGLDEVEDVLQAVGNPRVHEAIAMHAQGHGQAPTSLLDTKAFAKC